MPKYAIQIIFWLKLGSMYLVKDFMWVSRIYREGKTKAKLLLLKLIHLFAREVLLLKKLEIKDTKTT